MTLIVMRNEEQHGPSGRAAFIAGKKLGNAVWRNRAKRRMRSVCGEIEHMFSNLDVLFVAKRTLNDAPYLQLVEDAKRAMRKSSAR